MGRRASNVGVHGRVWIALGGSALLGACFLPDLDLGGYACPCVDGYVCDEATQRCVSDPGAGGGATTSTSTTTTSGGGAGGASTGSAMGGGGAGGGQGVPLTPLVRSGDTTAGAIALTVAGAFRLEFTETTNWQIERWIDLPTSDIVNLAAQTQRNMVHEPVELEVGGMWYGADEASFVDVSLTDQTPARALVETTLTYPPGGPFTVQSTYTVYASGRVGVRVRITNGTSSSQLIDAAEVHHTSVNEALTWDLSNFATGNAAMFQRNDGPTPYPTILSVSHQTVGNPGQDFTTNLYWDTGGAMTMTPGQTYERTGEFQVGLGAQTLTSLTDRANDVMQPVLFVSSGGTPAGGGYDAGAAAYTITATGTAVTFGVSGTQPRHAPAFVIDGWTTPDWSLTKDGAEIASSAMPDGTGAIAYQDLAASRLVLVTLDTIPTSASDPERTFVLSAQ